MLLLSSFNKIIIVKQLDICFSLRIKWIEISEIFVKLITVFGYESKVQAFIRIAHFIKGILYFN